MFWAYQSVRSPFINVRVIFGQVRVAKQWHPHSHLCCWKLATRSHGREEKNSPMRGFFSWRKMTTVLIVMSIKTPAIRWNIFVRNTDLNSRNTTYSTLVLVLLFAGRAAPRVNILCYNTLRCRDDKTIALIVNGWDTEGPGQCFCLYDIQGGSGRCFRTVRRPRWFPFLGLVMEQGTAYVFLGYFKIFRDG